MAAEPGTRGTTTIADRVVEKIAACAALEVPNCLGIERKFVVLDTGRRKVQSKAVTDGSITSLTLSIAVRYPASIIGTSRAVRVRVMERVETLCALAVDHVDISVSELARIQRKESRVQ